MLYLRLFWEFFKTGLFAVGGGMATIPFLYNMADATGWFTRNDIANMIAVGESTPGPIGVNMATYVGYVTGGNIGGLPFAILGAVVATVGLVTPSIIVILIIASFLKSFRENRLVENAFYGLRPASTGLIAAAVAGWFVLPEELVMQIGVDGRPSNMMPKQFGLLIPPAVGLVGAGIASGADKEKRLAGFITLAVAAAIAGFTFFMNL